MMTDAERLELAEIITNLTITILVTKLKAISA
jgi:hypothetical protein